MPKETKSQTQLERILAVAAKLFAERGYHAIGMTELGDAVGLGRGALYHHIKSKEDVLYNITRQYISVLVEQGNKIVEEETDPGQRLQLLGRQLMETIAVYQAELTVCFREIHSLTGARKEEVLMLHGEYERIWRRVLIDGEKKGVFRPFNQIRLKGLLGMFFYTYIWMKPEGAQGAEAISEIFNDVVIKALAE